MSRKADAIIQSVLLGICLITSFTIIWPMLILIGIGGYQVISNIIALVRIKELRALDQTLLKVYWVAVLGYFLVLVLFIALEAKQDLMLFWVAILPWTYAVYCLVLTYLRAYNDGPAKAKKKHHQHNQFLDNLDF